MDLKTIGGVIIGAIIALVVFSMVIEPMITKSAFETNLE